MPSVENLWHVFPQVSGGLGLKGPGQVCHDLYRVPLCIEVCVSRTTRPLTCGNVIKIN